MASCPITSWELEDEEVETVRECIFLGSKITAVVTAGVKLKDTCSLEGKLGKTLTSYLKAEMSLCQQELLLFNCSVLSDSLQSHGLQQASLPCPSPSPRVCSNSGPLSMGCHSTISSSIVLCHQQVCILSKLWFFQEPYME